MSSLPKSYDPKLIEDKWSSFWEKGGFFVADAHSQKEPFCIVIPPPNVTGVLHMGHALVNTLQDVLIRWKRMLGFEVLWVPGTDHAGIATQGVVEKNLFTQTGKRRKDFEREEFLSHVWEWKQQSEGKILGQIKKLGCSCDWTRLCFTMDPQCNRAVRVAFKKMFDEKLIYRGDYLVHWDPATQTALSDDEVEYEERHSFLWHIRYPLEEGGGSIIVATTRPETMLGDTAIAVHPEDLRYQSLIGKKVRLPLTGRSIPIIADPFVDSSFGSGAVKITPAHDFTDFEVGHRHNLPFINIMTPDGKMNEKGGKWAGLDLEEAREAIVHALHEQKLLEKTEPHVLRVGLSYRSKAVVQPYLSKQWFVNMRPFKKRLLTAVQEKRVKLAPSHWEETYFHWIENLRDWCISRQLWWGHRIPIWYHAKDKEKMICFDGEGLPPEVEKDPASWVQDPDVLDTWFSSGLWPFSTLGWPEKTADFKKFYPTSTLITAHDILFFWVARMIMMGEYFTGEAPFQETFLHGLIYGKSYWKTLENGAVSYLSSEEKKKYDLGAPLADGIESKWEKMSKTKGNVIDPLAMIEEYGTDALRMTLCFSATQARQIDLDQRRFEEFKNFANKIWNGFRFVMMNLEDFSLEGLMKPLDHSLFGLEDRWIFSVLNRTIKEIEESFTQYAFDKAASRGYEFFWNDFCAVYVEIAKPVLFGKAGTPQLRAQKQKILTIILLSAIRLLHPIAPFITEEIFHALKHHFLKGDHFGEEKRDFYTHDVFASLHAHTCAVAPFPKTHLQDIDPVAEEEFGLVNEVVRRIRNLRTEMQIPPSEKTELYCIGKGAKRCEANERILLALVPLSRLIFTNQKPEGFGAESTVGDLGLFLPIPESLKEKEKARLQKEKEKIEKMILQTESKLANQEFCSKAPEAIVHNLQKALIDARRQLQEILQKTTQI